MIISKFIFTIPSETELNTIKTTEVANGNEHVSATLQFLYDSLRYTILYPQ